MEIQGLFSQPSYTTVNDPYMKPKKRDSKVKGKAQMMTHTSRSKAASKDGYFGEFGRAFEKEPIHDAVGARRKANIVARKKMLGGDYKPASPVKKAPSSGHYQGTFSGKVNHFLPEEKRKEKKKPESINFMTNPAKKGTGGHHFGGNTVGITIGNLPEYKTSPYNAERVLAKKEAQLHRKAIKGSQFKAPCGPDGGGVFDKNPFREPKSMPKAKKPDAVKKIQVPFRPCSDGGPMSSGGNTKDNFTKFSYVGEKANTKIRQPKKAIGVFKPISNPKCMPQPSIVKVNVSRSVNPNNAARVSVL